MQRITQEVTYFMKHVFFRERTVGLKFSYENNNPRFIFRHLKSSPKRYITCSSYPHLNVFYVARVKIF